MAKPKKKAKPKAAPKPERQQKKQKVEVEAVGSVSLAMLEQRIAKQYGEGVTMSGDSPEALALRIVRIPTGIFPFDYATAGGFPRGRISLVSGFKGSGKTTKVLLAIAEWMRRTARRSPQPKASWVDQENVYDPDWARACGVDLSRLRITKPKYAEEAMDVFSTYLGAGEIELHALDSIAAMIPAKALEASALDDQQALLARRVNKWVAQVTGLMNAWQQQQAPRTVLLLNQVRTKLTGFGTVVPMIEPGGLGQIFAASLVVRCRRMKYVFERDTDAANAIGPLYAINHFKVEQSKTSPPHVEGEYQLWTRGPKRATPDTFEAFVLRAKEREHVRQLKSGAWLWGNETDPVYISGRTQADVLDALEQMPCLWTALAEPLIARGHDLVE